MRIHRNEKYMMAATLGGRRRSVFKMSDIETTDVDMFTIGNNLRELREQKRVTQMQVVDVLYPLCKDRRRYERYEPENADKVDQIF